MQQHSAFLLIFLCLLLVVDESFGFHSIRTNDFSRTRSAQFASTNSLLDQKEAKLGDLLGELPTPSLLLELSLMEKFLNERSGHKCSIDEFLSNPTQQMTQMNGTLEDYGPLYIHTRVTSTEKRDKVVAKQGSGKSLSVCDIDTPVELAGKAGAYLGLGLANHHVGGYYWARSMGIGASLPAHGIYFGPSDWSNQGELYWRKRGPGDPAASTEENSNSNDGKRSEWADFLAVGDTVQLVPNDALSILESDSFPVLLGVRRAGRPLGADPIVETIWRKVKGGGWEPE